MKNGRQLFPTGVFTRATPVDVPMADGRRARVVFEATFVQSRAISRRRLREGIESMMRRVYDGNDTGRTRAGGHSAFRHHYGKLRERIVAHLAKASRSTGADGAVKAAA